MKGNYQDIGSGLTVQSAVIIYADIKKQRGHCLKLTALRFGSFLSLQKTKQKNMKLDSLAGKLMLLIFAFIIYKG